MAELEVVTQYRSVPARVALALVVLAMPVWGILAPFMAILGVWSTLFSSPPSSMHTLITYIGIILGLVAMTITGVLLTLAFADNRVIASRSGLRIPFFLSFFTLFQRNFEWSQVRQVRLTGDASEPLSKLGLLFYTANKRKLVLKLSAIKEADVEQLLLAADVWCTEAVKDSRLEDLHKRLQGSAGEVDRKLSYTAMWEDEMERRFASTAFMPLEPGLTLQSGRLKIVRQLSFGGLSAIYLCQESGKDLVVLKESVVPADSKPEIRAKAEELFAREAQFLMKLDHPDIVKVFDYFVENGRNYMLLEYLTGQDLRQVVRQHGPQKESSVVNWTITLCDIISYLHEREPAVIHRDLTPDNVVLRDDGRLKLIDFGAANEFIGTATGTLVGKQAYISPEQLRGKPTPSSDIYGLGCTMYFLLTGEDPEPLAASSPKEKRSDLSDHIDQIVLSCTDMDAASRPASAREIKKQLELKTSGK